MRIMEIYEKDYYPKSPNKVPINDPELFIKVKHDHSII